MIRSFTLLDLDSILQIEKQSFPKSPYDKSTFIHFHRLYPETFLLYADVEKTDRLNEREEIKALRSKERSFSAGYPHYKVPLDPSLSLGFAQDGELVEPKGGDCGVLSVQGYVLFTKEGHIISIAVHPRCRRQGIGKQLLQAMMKMPRLKRCWAEVRKSNHGARDFYSTLGFQITGMIPDYYGDEDALIIQR